MEKEKYEYTNEIVKYISNLNYSRLPKDVVQQTKIVLLDTLGVLLASSSPMYAASKAIMNVVRQMGGKEEATVVGDASKTSSVHAALANGTMADNIELDDSHPKSAAHVAAPVIPSALAMCEREKADGKSLITSIVIGYDIDVRVVLGLDPSSLYKRGFHPSAIGGYFGSTAAAAKILDLDEDLITKAFGLTGSQASGIMAWETDPTQMPKSFQMGLAASGGVLSCLLAANGFSGPPAILEGKYGVFNAFSDEYHLEQLTDKLGARFEITLTGLKQYSCCKFLHASLDSFLGLVREHNLQPENIDQITIKIPPIGVPIIDNNRLISHNAQYILAVAAIDRSIRPSDIFNDRRNEKEIAVLSKRIKVVGDAELAKVFPGYFSEPAIAEITTKDGRELTKRTDFPKGDPGNQMSQKEVEEKFRSLAMTVISKQKTERILSLVQDLENIDSVGRITALLRKAR